MTLPRAVPKQGYTPRDRTSLVGVPFSSNGALLRSRSAVSPSSPCAEGLVPSLGCSWE